MKINNYEDNYEDELENEKYKYKKRNKKMKESFALQDLLNEKQRKMILKYIENRG